MALGPRGAALSALAVVLGTCPAAFALTQPGVPSAPPPGPAASPRPLAARQPPSSAATAPLTPEAGSTPSEVRPARTDHPGLALRAGVFAEVGLLPGPSLGPRLVVAFTHSEWSLELGVAALVPRRAELNGPGSAAADFYWLGGQVVFCRVIGGPVTTCLGGESGRLAGTGADADENLTHSDWWLAGVASAFLRGPLMPRLLPLSWETGVSAALAVIRPEVGLDELGVVHRASGVSGRFILGLGWH